MALSEKSRHDVFEGLRPLIGEEATSEVLSYFPASDTEPPATLEQLTRVEGSIRHEILLTRAELRTEIADLRGELHTEIAGVRGEIADLRGELHEALRQQTLWLVGALIAFAGIIVAAAAILR